MVHTPDKTHLNKKDEILPVIWLTIPSGIVLGIILVTIILPGILPGIADSLTGNEPKIFWYLSRAAALCGYFILWLSMMLGLAMTSDLAGKGTTKAAFFEIHKFTSLLGLGFASFHAVLLLGDQYLKFGFLNLLIPFSAISYRSFWVGLGQVAFYVWLVLISSFYVRRQISRNVWRWIHYASFATFLLALIHGLTSGTDTGLAATQFFYWISGGLFMLLSIFRILNVFLNRKTDQSD